ncbi:MAG: hypothetical protein WC491_08385 [Candidatus Omnitrophota bacterium]
MDKKFEELWYVKALLGALVTVVIVTAVIGFPAMFWCDAKTVDTIFMYGTIGVVVVSVPVIVIGLVKTW